MYRRKRVRRATVRQECAHTITTRQRPDTCTGHRPRRWTLSVLTERECWRLMGYSDEDFDRAKAVQERNGEVLQGFIYDQAGNSIAVPII
ncbi:MAG: DNA cytosine methyltransferase [Gallintestinimicrobium sp.]